MQTEGDIRKVVVLGSGPAGLTAALYTARAQLKPLVLHGDTPGGQLVTTTVVENYPGFVDGIDGTQLLDDMTAQAKRFGAEFENHTLIGVDASSQPLKLSLYGGTTLLTRSLIIATGAVPRKLGLESESKYWAKGVTSCATCDGYFFRGKDVCVIGGGDSAMEEAQFLTRMCSKVYLLHRRDTFRASKIMAERTLANPKIEPVYNVVVDEILGDGTSVTGVRVKDVASGAARVIELAGVFLAIGHIPNTAPFKGLLDLDENGYIKVKPQTTYTNATGIFACGDCVDHVYRQAITAAGTGCMAALDAERWLETQHH